VFRHLAASRAVKFALLALTLGLCGYGLYSERAATVAALHQLSWIPVTGAFLAAIAGLGCMMLSWRTLLADLGSPLPLPVSVRVLFVAQLAKYVPGAVWAPAAQVELARGYQVPRKRSATAAVVGMLVALATALLVAAIALPLNSQDAARHYWWALALALPALLGLYPPLTTSVLNHLLRLARRPPLERRISMAGMARSVGWSLVGWAFFSVHAWLLVANITGKGLQVLPLAAGAYALAWSVGFILIPFPGGVGPRELALIAALAPIMPAGPAIAVAVISRVAMTIADLTWALLALGLGGHARRGHGGQPGQSGRRPDSAPSVPPRRTDALGQEAGV
jgi:uncharacterized membrane protein YbhN (UPF0104 family)